MLMLLFANNAEANVVDEEEEGEVIGNGVTSGNESSEVFYEMKNSCNGSSSTPSYIHLNIMRKKGAMALRNNRVKIASSYLLPLHLLAYTKR